MPFPQTALVSVTMPGGQQSCGLGFLPFFFSSGVHKMKISMPSEGRRYLEDTLETETTIQSHGSAVIQKPWHLLMCSHGALWKNFTEG